MSLDQGTDLRLVQEDMSVAELARVSVLNVDILAGRFGLLSNCENINLLCQQNRLNQVV